MGMLLLRETGERVVLRANHVFGRNAKRSDTLLSYPDASLLHAVVRWRNGTWTVTNHGRNGTTLDGERLHSGTATPLVVGQVLSFGFGDHACWHVIDLASPANVLVPLDRRLEPLPLARHTLLPDVAAPEISLYEERPGHWVMERHGELKPLNDGDLLDVAGTPYRLALIDVVDDTHAGIESPVTPLLIFRLSLDEEHTRLHLRYGGRLVDLGERIHHYALATLGRKRLADARAGLDASAIGWLESARLARMLGIEPTHLNIQIFRARDQLMNALPALGSLTQVIERRRGGLRMGAVGLEIHRGSELEGRLLPAAKAEA